jgi:GNAT superfamily N-acetyltransferase
MAVRTLVEMTASDLPRIAEIDRSEHITQQYRSRNGALELIDVDIRWDGPTKRELRHDIASWAPILDQGGVMLGAFDGDRLVGFAILDPSLSEDCAQLTALYVTRTHRGHGVGRSLTDEIVRLARAAGAERLYVSATQTRGTVEFYLAQGFEVLATPDPRLFALEPDDIHMELRL